MQPNILYIDCHDLGNWLGCYGRSQLKTPNIDRLAGEGARFTQMIATAPICMPSRASLYSGRMPHSVDALGQFPLRPDTVCMAEHLRRAGYATTLVGTLKIRNDPAWAGFEQVVDARNDSEATERTEAFLRGKANSETPFFASLSFSAVHRPFGAYFDAEVAGQLAVPPYLPDTPPVRQDLATLHRQIEMLDDRVSQVLAGLEAFGLADRTLLIFTTEHGPAIARAKHTLYDSGLRTALLMRYRSKIEAGCHCDHLLSNVDLLPTILELAGAEPARNLHGYSFAPLLAGRPYPEREYVYAEHTWGRRAGLPHYTPSRAVRTRQHKYIRNFSRTPPYVDTDWLARFGPDRGLPAKLYSQPAPPVELYDLAADPFELRNRAGESTCAAIETRLRERLDAFLAETDDPILAGSIVHPEALADVPLWEMEPNGGYHLRPYWEQESGERPFA